jgi:hypothetical protein
MRYSPEKIFSGKIPALDINFIDPQDWKAEGYTEDTGETDEEGNSITTGDKMNERSITQALHGTIASWYVSLRNLAVVALMLVLVYVGIRIVISSTASDKAKYKQMLIDWLVALCILFCLHYIMTFTTTIVNEITGAITGAQDTNGNNVAVKVEGDSDSTVEFNTDLMGLIRFKMQAPNVSGKILYLILYLAMVIYTFMFTFYYLRRVLTIAFLTLISPLVAMTYPIDKIRDGKAQAFDMWLKEYVFNALLQPFHLIIYSIFVGSAVDLAAKNPLFAIVALAFITPAEKILRKFFGFEKASTAGALGAVASAAGGAAVMNHMRNLMAPKKGAGGGGSKGIKTKNKPEGSAPSLEDAFGNGSGKRGNPEENSSRRSNINLQDTDFRDNSTVIRGGNQETASDDKLSAAASTDGMHMQNGLWVPDSASRQNTQPEPTPPPEPSNSGSGSGSDGIHLKDTAFEWSDNDTRGAGAYLGGIARSGASWAGNKIANSAAGQGAIRFGRAVSGSAKSVRDMAAARARQVGALASAGAQKVGDLGRTYIPKPIRNSAGTLARATGHAAVGAAKAAGHAALGAGNVALQTGMAAGKAALKAAPGAILGMAAGIASDDLSDIGKYTLAGAALSSTIGSSAVAQAGSFVADSYRQGSGSAYEAALKQRKENYIQDNEELYRQKYPDASKKELKAKLEQGAYYDSIGIEGKDTFKAVKLEDRIKEEIAQTGVAEEEANRRVQAQTAAIMKEVKDYSAKDLREESTVRDLRTDLSKRLESQGLTGNEKMKTVDMIVSEMKYVRGVENDF